MPCTGINPATLDRKGLEKIGTEKERRFMRFEKKLLLLSFLLLIGLLIAVPLLIILLERQQGKTLSGAMEKSYYVPPTGNDTSHGSQTHPFATLQKAALVVTPGTAVHVLPGTYTQPVIITRSGTA